jgi:hypothetical protein
MTAPKESAKSKLKRLNILPRFLCLCLAVFLWLLIVNLEKQDNGNEQETDNPYEITEVTP